MEDLDHRIVALLLQDGRISFTDLGKVTGLSTSAVHQRVRRLEERGVIQGYRAIIDQNAMGLPMLAFISVTPTDPSAPDDVADRLRDIRDIEACHSVAGEESYSPRPGWLPRATLKTCWPGVATLALRM